MHECARMRVRRRRRLRLSTAMAETALTTGAATPVSVKRMSRTTRVGEEKASTKSVKAMVTARRMALRKMGAACSARFLRQSARRSALSAPAPELQSASSSRSAARSAQTVEYDSMSSTRMRASVSSVSAAPTRASVRRGDRRRAPPGRRILCVCGKENTDSLRTRLARSVEHERDAQEVHEDAEDVVFLVALLRHLVVEKVLLLGR